MTLDDLVGRQPELVGGGRGMQIRGRTPRVGRDWRVMMPLAHAALRCGARTRTGMSCKGPAMGANGDVACMAAAHREGRQAHGGYGTELRRLIRALRGEQRRLLELVE